MASPRSQSDSAKQVAVGKIPTWNSPFTCKIDHGRSVWNSLSGWHISIISRRSKALVWIINIKNSPHLLHRYNIIGQITGGDSEI